MGLWDKFEASAPPPSPTETQRPGGDSPPSTGTILPPDAPASDPTLAVAGVEGQLYENPAGQRYVVKKGKWIFAGAESRAMFDALKGGMPPLDASPKEPEPEPAVEEKKTRKKKAPPVGPHDIRVDPPIEWVLGQPPKLEAPPAIATAIAAATNPPTPTPVDKGPVSPVAPASPPVGASVVRVFVHCVPSFPSTPIEPHVETVRQKLTEVAETREKREGKPECGDFRLSNLPDFAYGKWPGAFALALKEMPPPPGDYTLLARGPLYDCVIEAYGTTVRGVV